MDSSPSAQNDDEKKAQNDDEKKAQDDGEGRLRMTLIGITYDATAKRKKK